MKLLLRIQFTISYKVLTYQEQVNNLNYCNELRIGVGSYQLFFKDLVKIFFKDIIVHQNITYM